MTSGNDCVPYSPLPSNTPQQTVVVLTVYRPHRSRTRRRLCLGICYTAAILLAAAAVYLLYPSDPTLQLVRLKLNRINLRVVPEVVLDLSFDTSVRVRNENFYSLDYDYLGVAIGYRGRRLGFATSKGGRVAPLSSSYVNATFELNGLAVIHDVFYLLEDFSTGVIPFDSVSIVKGSMGFLFISIPFEAKVSCEISVNVHDQIIQHQNCHPV